MELYDVTIVTEGGAAVGRARMAAVLADDAGASALLVASEQSGLALGELRVQKVARFINNTGRRALFISWQPAWKDRASAVAR